MIVNDQHPLETLTNEAGAKQTMKSVKIAVSESITFLLRRVQQLLSDSQ